MFERESEVEGEKIFKSENIVCVAAAASTMNGCCHKWLLSRQSLDHRITSYSVITSLLPMIFKCFAFFSRSKFTSEQKIKTPKNDKIWRWLGNPNPVHLFFTLLCLI